MNTINKTRSNFTQSWALKDVTTTLQGHSNKIDLQRTLELLNTTNDVDLQLKLFSTLSAFLMFNKNANIDFIIKCSAVYDRIYNVLSNGLPRKATVSLNFLSTLLYVDAEEGTTNRRTLALYARNMTRISGCLGVMTDMFTNCMMFQETWKALCQCLAVACSGCEINQSYCTHLIPVCIQKCSQTNIDVLLVLQSLLLNHNRNIQLFLDCNGTAIFTREILHYDKSLQLLTIVVQFSAASSLILCETKILDDLRDFVRLYGPRSQIGQKAVIILHHIESRSNSRGLNYHISQNIVKETDRIERNNNMTINKAGNELDDTKTLMQNVMKEISSYKQSELGHLKKAASKVEISSLIGTTSAMNISSKNRQIRHGNTLNKPKKVLDQRRLNSTAQIKHCSTATELSFSFLQNQYKHGLNRNTNCHRNETTNKTFRYNDIRTDQNTENTITQIENDLSVFYKTISLEKPSQADLKYFRPIFSSTPKHERQILNEINFSKIATRKPNLTTQSQAPLQRTTKVHKRKPKKIPRNLDKDLRNRSISSRFFSAINESCTTLVKTVTNIFKKKDTPDSSKESRCSNLEDQDNNSCSFSFLNYMEKRDAVLNNTLMKKINKAYCDFSLDTKSCETCDDTEVLKQKLAKDDHLKQTVKKLKMGINLYGCNFKKISKTMWPRESYMTPVVLYNLYRKLLLK